MPLFCREFQVRRVSVPLFDPEFDPLQARQETVVVGELEKSKEEEVKLKLQELNINYL